MRTEDMLQSVAIALCLFIFPVQIVQGVTDIIVERPFYLRARIRDSHTASVKFEIAEADEQRTCQRYKFTIRRNRERPYSMPEQNLTFWRNSLELKHLAAGKYRICAILCSEHDQATISSGQNSTAPISACLTIRAYRSHFLVLTLYVLVVTFLAFSQMVFTLRKRKFQARIKTTLVEVEHALQKWRSSQVTTQQPGSYNTLQSLVTLPASPILTVTDDQDPRRLSSPIIFHLDTSDDHSMHAWCSPCKKNQRRSLVFSLSNHFMTNRRPGH